MTEHHQKLRPATLRTETNGNRHSKTPPPNVPKSAELHPRSLGMLWPATLRTEKQAETGKTNNGKASRRTKQRGRTKRQQQKQLENKGRHQTKRQQQKQVEKGRQRVAAPKSPAREGAPSEVTADEGDRGRNRPRRPSPAAPRKERVGRHVWPKAGIRGSGSGNRPLQFFALALRRRFSRRASALRRSRSRRCTRRKV